MLPFDGLVGLLQDLLGHEVVVVGQLLRRVGQLCGGVGLRGDRCLQARVAFEQRLDRGQVLAWRLLYVLESFRAIFGNY